MRIHTDLTFDEVRNARSAAGAPIAFQTITEHASRTHARSFEIRLTGSGGRTNSGRYGAGDFDGATWDEWGAFLGALYAADETARCGGTSKRPTYADAAHFHFETGDRFEARPTHPHGLDGVRLVHLPADTHPRHSWSYADAGWTCTHKAGCTATRPSIQDAETFRRDHKIGA
jgi:hypothetical protein